MSGVLRCFIGSVAQDSGWCDLMEEHQPQHILSELLCTLHVLICKNGIKMLCLPFRVATVK